MIVWKSGFSKNILMNAWMESLNYEFLHLYRIFTQNNAMKNAILKSVFVLFLILEFGQTQVIEELSPGKLHEILFKVKWLFKLFYLSKWTKNYFNKNKFSKNYE